jgi:hypothetical protein
MACSDERAHYMIPEDVFDSSVLFSDVQVETTIGVEGKLSKNSTTFKSPLLSGCWKRRLPVYEYVLEYP